MSVVQCYSVQLSVLDCLAVMVIEVYGHMFRYDLFSIDLCCISNCFYESHLVLLTDANQYTETNAHT